MDIIFDILKSILYFMVGFAVVASVVFFAGLFFALAVHLIEGLN